MNNMRKLGSYDNIVAKINKKVKLNSDNLNLMSLKIQN
jgi:hypothetical protein